MAEFYVSNTNDFFAGQIADLLNKHNRLTRRHTAHTIKAGNTKYFVELLSAPTIEPKVIGCVGLDHEPFAGVSKIKHVCIDPAYRRFGIAKKLIGIAAQNSPTEYIYMTIREDNKPSLYMAKSLGFVLVRKDWVRDHHLISVGRRK